MKLPIKFLDKKGKAEYYLALVLQNEKVISIVFEKEEESIRFISSDEEFFKETIEDATDNEFLDVLDKVITTAETALPNDIETHKTLFGLKDNWIEEDKIKKEYRDKLKLASDELALEPIGFMAFSESLINLLQKEEGAPVTAILVNVGKKYLTLYWVRAGKILETKSSEIHESVSYTTDSLMKHFQTGGNLPTKIVIFDSDEDELTQEFIGHQWSKSLSFLHIPQIQTLPEDSAAKAMLLGAATQMRSNLILDLNKNLDDQQLNQETTKQKTEELAEEKETNGDNDLQAENEENEKEEDAFEIGDEEPKVIEQDNNAAEFFGFVEGVDVVKQAPAKAEEVISAPQEIIQENFEEIPEVLKQEEEKTITPAVGGVLVAERLKLFVAKLLNFAKKIKINSGILNKANGKNKLLLIIPAILFIILLIILYFYIFRTTVQVTVFVNPKQDQKQSDITFSTSTDIANKTLAFESVSVTEDGSITTQATGKTYQGDKAKGTVTVFNNGNSTLNLSSGTKITSSNNLDYTLDNSVNVASASGDIFSGTKAGTANVNVTASDIGQDYNLPSGTKFSIGSNSDIAAKNDNAFSGGTKKAITVVSSDDLNKLLSDLPKNLEQKARDDLKSKAVNDKTIISQFISEDVTNKNFDKKAGDQSSTVTLKGTVDFEAISYANQDMTNFANTLFPDNEKVVSENLTVDASNIKQQKNGDITANLTINAKLMPKVDIDALRKQLAGEPKLKANNTLSNIDQAENVEINFNPNIPLLPQNMPGDYQKIFINITSK